jgi:hypothetical protein
MKKIDNNIWIYGMIIAAVIAAVIAIAVGIEKPEATAASSNIKVYYIIQTDDQQISGIESICWRDRGVYIGENIECGIQTKNWEMFIPYTSINAIHKVIHEEISVPESDSKY